MTHCHTLVDRKLLHKYFGVPPHEEPPNHYRLLGLVDFEADRGVIRHAAEQRTAYLKSCPAGLHEDDRKSLEAAVLEARRCLLDMNEKMAYDAELQVRRGEAWRIHLARVKERENAPRPEFDPHYQWLGIPPEEQPPDAYRLLGAARYESNTQILRNLADQRMAYLRMQASGRWAEQSQSLLTEVASAKVRLLDDRKKAAYDEELRAAERAAAHARAFHVPPAPNRHPHDAPQAAFVEPPTPVAQPVPVAPPPPPPPPNASPAPTAQFVSPAHPVARGVPGAETSAPHYGQSSPMAPSIRATRKKSSKSLSSIAGSFIAGVLLMVLVGAVVKFFQRDETVATNDAPREVAPQQGDPSKAADGQSKSTGETSTPALESSGGQVEDTLGKQSNAAEQGREQSASPGENSRTHVAANGWRATRLDPLFGGEDNGRIGKPQAMALSSDWILLGSETLHGNGGAYFFHKSPSRWRLAGRIVSEETENQLLDDQCVGLTENVAAIGAPHAGGRGAGAVYVLEKQGPVWKQTATLKPKDGEGGTMFGRSVALDQNRLLVGAGSRSHSQHISILHFERVNGSWAAVGKITPRHSGTNRLFGDRIALHGDWAIFGGASREPIEAGSGVEIYKYDGRNWIFKGKFSLDNTSAQVAAYFGACVALENDVAVIGSPYDGAAANNTEPRGAVYILHRIDDRWEQQHVLFPPKSEHVTQFGGSVDLHQGKLAVSAFRRLASTSKDMTLGAYLFEAAGDKWPQTADFRCAEKMAPSDGHVALSEGRIALTGLSAAGQTSRIVVFEREDAVLTESASLGQ